MSEVGVASPALSSTSSAAASDSERALKAQRAREKLKKFSKKKAATSTNSPLVHASAPASSDTGPPSPALSSVSNTVSLPPPSQNSPVHANVDLDETEEVDYGRQPAGTPNLSQQPDQERLQGIDELLFGSSSSTLASIAQANLEVKRAQELAHGRQQTIALLVTEKQQLAAALAESKRAVDDVQSRLEQALVSADKCEGLQSQVNELQIELAQAQATHTAKEKECADYKERADAITAELDMSTIALERANSSLQSAENKITILTKRLEDEAATTREQLSSLESRLKSKSAHSDGIELELSKQRVISAKNKAELDALAEEVTSNKESAKRQQNAISNLESEKEQLESQLADSQAMSAELQSAAATLRKQLGDTQDQASALRATVDHIQAELSQTSAALASMQEALETAEASASAAITRRDALQRDNEELMADLSDLRIKIVKLTDDNTELREKADSLYRSVRDKDTEMAKVRSQFEAVAATAEEVKTLLNDRESALSAAKTEILQLDGRYEKSQNDLRSREGELVSVNALLRQAQVDLAASQRKTEDALADAADAQKDAEEAAAISQQSKETNDELARDIDALREQAQEYERDIEELRQQLTEAQEQQQELRQLAPEGTPPPTISPLPYTPARTHLHRDSLAPSVITNGSAVLEAEDWPTSDEEGPRQQSPPKEKTRSHAAISYDAEDLDHARHQLRQLETELSMSRTEAATLNRKMQVAEQKVDELNALILIERQKTMKAMAEVFALGTSQNESQAIMGDDVLVSPQVSPNARKGRPPSLHRRSSSHLPTLVESLEPGQRQALVDVSPRGTTFPKSAQPSPFMAPHKSASSKSKLAASTDLSGAVAAQQQAQLPPTSRHARRESLSQLQTRMQAELGETPGISVISPTPVVEQYSFSRESTASPVAPRRKSARLYNDHIFCAACTGDLIVI